MSKQEEIYREEIYHILSIKETVGLRRSPSDRCLISNNPLWLSLKTTRLLNYLHDNDVVISIPIKQGESLEGCTIARIEPLIEEKE